jgi:hypothetical protein
MSGEGDGESPAALSPADAGVANAEPPPVEFDHDRQARVAEARVGLEESLAEREQVAAGQAADDRLLRRSIAYAFTAAAFFQIALADFIFVIYAFVNHWDIDALLGAWLGATVVQVIAVALVVVKSLFPSRDKAR